MEVSSMDTMFHTRFSWSPAPCHIPLPAVSHRSAHTVRYDCWGWERYSSAALPQPSRDTRRRTRQSQHQHYVTLKTTGTTSTRGKWLTVALICLALSAYFSVLWVSSYILDEGLTFAIMTVLQFPPKESFSSRVSLLSLYGMWLFLLWNKKEIKPPMVNAHVRKEAYCLRIPTDTTLGIETSTI